MTRTTCARAVFVFLVFSIASAVQASDALFPEYDCIKPNVSFWTRVYTEFTTSQGIMHDSRDLTLIYEILELKPHDAPGSRKSNRKHIKAAKNKYKRILNMLAQNPETRNPQCRRVAALFGKDAGPAVYRKAAERIRCQIGQKDRFSSGLIRSGAYIDEIRKIFSAYGLPEELAYLPHVESSFNINAYSKFGAAGMWQFTRSTGKRFMDVGYVLDERRDPIRATHAAAQLLKDNYTKLGSWPLAVSAYNHGTNGMQRAKDRHGSYPIIFQKYTSRTFRFASRNFYSEFLAARKIAKDHETFFGKLPLAEPEKSHTVKLAGYLSLKDACDHFGVSPDQIKSLNPALRPPVYTGQKYIPKGYILRLPAKTALARNEPLAAVPATRYKSEQKPSRFYTVQRGDTAGRIARLHGVKLSDLVLANNLNHRATIYPRQTLRIPLPGEPVMMAAKSARSGQPQTAQTAGAATDKPGGHQSRQSDTTETALRYPKPVLASVIPLSPPAATRTEELLTAEKAEKENPSLEIVSADVHISRVQVQGTRKIGTIQVEVEETLGHYAEWAEVSAASIRKLNKLRFGQTLHLDQSLIVPLKRVDPQQFEQRRYEYHKRLQEDFFAVYEIGELKPYHVRSGDTYWSLCRDTFGVPMWLLRHCNPNTDLENLRKDQKLMIPIVEKITADDPGTAEDDA